MSHQLMYYLCHDKVDFGTTPLMRASLKGRVEMVRVLLENGAAVDKQDDVMQNSVYTCLIMTCGLTPLMLKKWPLRGTFRKLVELRRALCGAKRGHKVPFSAPQVPFLALQGAFSVPFYTSISLFLAFSPLNIGWLVSIESCM